MKRKALGRGLSALLADFPVESAAQKNIQDIQIGLIDVNQFQPRAAFNPNALMELAESIRAQGVLQPLLVREHTAAAGRFQLIAGERRLRASLQAGLDAVPCIVLQADEAQMLEIALVENIQRADLSPVEEARAYKHLSERFSLTQEEIAEKVGKSREYVANALRLLNLPEAVLVYLDSGELTTGHAKVLLSLKHQDAMRDMAAQILQKGLSVRETENLVRNMSAPAEISPEKSSEKAAKQEDVHIADLRRILEESFQTKVNIKMRGANKGAIEIFFYDLDHLQSLLKRWNVENL
ncbi:MAG: ParB/RepB/Spo0J family partition protein [Candidatus Omnitrophota bacterium]